MPWILSKQAADERLPAAPSEWCVLWRNSLERRSAQRPGKFDEVPSPKTRAARTLLSGACTDHLPRSIIMGRTRTPQAQAQGAAKLASGPCRSQSQPQLQPQPGISLLPGTDDTFRPFFLTLTKHPPSFGHESRTN